MKKSKSGMQWKVVHVHIDDLERTCEEWTERGWNVHSILGQLGNLAVVLNRMRIL
jgi:hypothetical protein